LLVETIDRFLALLLTFSKSQPSPYSLAQAKLNAHGFQIRSYKGLNLTETSQVALFAAWYVSDMAVPYRVAVLIGFFFDPNFDDKRVGVKFGRRISTPLISWLRCRTAPFKPHKFPLNSGEDSRADFGRRLRIVCVASLRKEMRVGKERIDARYQRKSVALLFFQRTASTNSFFNSGFFSRNFELVSNR
jgi:hypothetical protein